MKENRELELCVVKQLKKIRVKDVGGGWDVMAMFLFTLQSVSCLSSVYAAGSHTSS